MKTIKVKAFIDNLKDGFAEYLYEPIMDNIPYEAEDDVWEFEIKITNCRNITEEIGVDEEGCRAYSGVEVIEEDEDS